MKNKIKEKSSTPSTEDVFETTKMKLALLKSYTIQKKKKKILNTNNQLLITYKDVVLKKL